MLAGFEQNLPDIILIIEVSFLLILLFVQASIWTQRTGNKYKNPPPGPPSFGILGSYPTLLFTPTKWNWKAQVDNLKEKYGKVAAFSLGASSIVIISDLKVFKESFASISLYGRPNHTGLHIFRQPTGFIMRSDEEGKEVKRFSIKSLRNIGMGREGVGVGVDSMIAEEAEELAKSLKTKDGPIQTDHLFTLASFNIIWKLISGQKVAADDHAAQKLMQSVPKIAGHTLNLALILVFPNLWKWIPYQFDDVKNGRSGAREYLAKMFKSRESSLNLDAEEGARHEDTSLADAFVRRIWSCSDVKSAFHGKRGYENAGGTITELFIAGLETTGSVLSWMCLFLALHPEKQKRLQKELDQVQGRWINLQDRSEMPYFEAVINETLRKSPPLPWAVPRITMEDTKVGGYDVPKDTIVIGNIHEIQNCRETWGDPETFRPERFLAPDEKTLIKYDAFIPFGFGRRRCSGEQFARDILFIVIARVVKEFGVELNPNEPRPKMEAMEQMGLTFHPPPHTLLFKRRQGIF